MRSTVFGTSLIASCLAFALYAQPAKADWETNEDGFLYYTGDGDQSNGDSAYNDSESDNSGVGDSGYSDTGIGDDSTQSGDAGGDGSEVTSENTDGQAPAAAEVKTEITDPATSEETVVTASSEEEDAEFCSSESETETESEAENPISGTITNDGSAQVEVSFGQMLNLYDVAEDYRIQASLTIGGFNIKDLASTPPKKWPKELCKIQEAELKVVIPIPLPEADCAKLTIQGNYDFDKQECPIFIGMEGRTNWGPDIMQTLQNLHIINR